MTTIDRRNFVRTGVGAAAVLAPSLAGLVACNADQSLGDPSPLAHRGRDRGAYGPLVPSPDCPELLIPEDFRVVKLSTTFAPSLADPSFIVPAALDGMAAFAMGANRCRLVRNHEVRDNAGVAPVIGPQPYDAMAGGGTSTLEVHIARGRDDNPQNDLRRRGPVTDVRLVREFASLSGTFVNCAGGLTPWGSWVTCEETVAGTLAGFAEPHGYAFEVSSRATGTVEPVALKAMGRFSHEALCLDPQTGFVYETEDQTFDGVNRLGSGLYRFVPEDPRRLRLGGKLQALAVLGQPNYNATHGQAVGVSLPCTWVDIDDPDPANTESDAWAVLRQGLDRGAAFFQRLEGCWFGDHSVYFNSTSGGNAGRGQVWQYRPRGHRKSQLRSGSIAGWLTLIFESPGTDVLDSPDNICVSPHGGLVLCEDGGGVQFMRGLTPGGTIFDLVQTNGNLSEFAGACFSDDGDVLFFNMQGSTSALGGDPGFTFAMFGPWQRGALG